MLVYLLIDYGPKPTGPIRNCAAAKQQISNFREVINASEGDLSPNVFHDYSRSRTKLSDLPNLDHLLKKAKDAGAVIWIDDFRRIFVKCDNAERVALFDEIRNYAGHFRDLRTKRDIGELSHGIARNILEVESPLRFSIAKATRRRMSADEKRQQTRKATQASQEARAEAAIQKASELQRLKTELLKNRDSITNTDLAREANERGLMTTWRSKWSAASVARALKRLD
mgnify:CR=1 FL=1|jgi:hypothetical protein|tara:strand:- start:16801 stop:17481 length:681 start_codon:yes stop_codon:yes gene_type:complete